MKRKVLIINYGFPPNEGIGGRRWAKHAKELARLGFEVNVIACQPNANEASPWTEDIIHESIRVHYLNRNYPRWIRKPLKGTFSSLKYRLALLVLKQLNSGTSFDLTVFWKNQLVEKAQELIKAGFNNVIVSGAPFNLTYYMSLLKESPLDFNLIVDFRDPWLGAKNYGMSNLSERRESTEKLKYKLVCENADIILSPNENMTAEFVALCNQPNLLHKFHYLMHSFDPMDIQPNQVKPNSDILLFIYGGTLYQGVKAHLLNLKKSLEELKLMNPEIYRKCRFEFYTPEIHYQSLFEPNENVKFYKPIGKEIFNKVKECAGLLLLYNDQNKNYPTSKIFEFLPYHKPFGVFSNGGKTLELLEREKWGRGINSPSEFISFIKEAKDPSNSFSFTNIELHNLENRTQELLQWFR